jgi:hypothetical protein
MTEPTIQCPICDYSLDLPDLEMVTGASGIPVPTPESISKLNMTEANMESHVSEHEPAEIMAGFRQADAYIEILEKNLEDNEQALANYVQHRINERGEPYQVEIPEPPRAKRDPDHDPDQTYIPAVPMGKRPEGVVGRKSG